MGTILTWLVVHRNNLIRAILGLSVAFLIGWGTMLSHQNKKLSESLEMALNNIEAYLGSLAGSLLANNVLKLSINELQTYNDKLVHDLDSVRAKLNIKPKYLLTAATQTQVLNVKENKGVGGELITILKDTTYSDSIKYNDLTTVYYTISNDSVGIAIDLKNTQYLYLYTDRHYKNKKSFIKRLFTLDFKKVNTYKYKILNTNDLLKTEDVRVVEITEK